MAQSDELHSAFFFTLTLNLTLFFVGGFFLGASLGDRDSPFILGLLKEGYKESTFENLSHKVRSKLNEKLDAISVKARDCYATTLKTAGVSRDNIGKMSGHSNSVVTEHFLASLDIEKTQEINQHIL